LLDRELINYSNLVDKQSQPEFFNARTSFLNAYNKMHRQSNTIQFNEIDIGKKIKIYNEKSTKQRLKNQKEEKERELEQQRIEEEIEQLRKEKRERIEKEEKERELKEEKERKKKELREEREKKDRERRERQRSSNTQNGNNNNSPPTPEENNERSQNENSSLKTSILGVIVLIGIIAAAGYAIKESLKKPEKKVPAR